MEPLLEPLLHFLRRKEEEEREGEKGEISPSFNHFLDLPLFATL